MFLCSVATVKLAAERVAAMHKPDQVIKALTFTDQGFLNITLTDQFIEEEINSILKHGLKFPLEEKKVLS
jgi:arginyl-tRNA synthetase